MKVPFDKPLFIVNPNSGTHVPSNLVPLIVDIGKKANVPIYIEFTQYRGHATNLALQGIDKGYDAIIAVGGDGTINEVARALVNTQIPLGIVPKGSGNGLARHLQIPLSSLDALHSLIHAQVVPMDTLFVNQNLSLNVSGIGFDAHIAGLFGQKGKRGLSEYLKLIARKYLTSKNFSFRMTWDRKETHSSAFIIAIANASQYGNNAQVAPMASIKDGILDLALIKKIPIYRLDLVHSIFSGTLYQSRYCDIFPFREAEIETSEPVPFHIDGEYIGMDTRFSISILPSSLHVLAPLGKTRI